MCFDCKSWRLEALFVCFFVFLRERESRGGGFTDAACGQSLIHGKGLNPVFFYDLHVALL
jgi:hypothetical protein